MSDDPVVFTMGQTWSGCWNCLATFAECTHLADPAAVSAKIVVTGVDYDTGIITVGESE